MQRSPSSGSASRSPSRSPSRSARIYQTAIKMVLPAEVFRTDGEEIVATFQALHGGCSGRWQQFRVLIWCLLALPKVGLLDHLEQRDRRKTSQLSSAAANDRSAPSSHGPQAQPAQRTHSEEPLMNRFALDLNYAFRTLRRAPAYTVSAVLLLALGVGAVTSIFTLVDNILLRPLPYPDNQRIAVIEDGSHSGPFWRAIQEHETVDLWAAAWTDEMNLTGQGDPRTLHVGQVSEDFFQLFGARAINGRLIAPDDFDTADRVVLSYTFWRETLGSDPAVIGTKLSLDGETVEVVGVVERGFSAPEAITGATVDLWRPLFWANEDFQELGYHVLQIAGRLSPSTSLAAFQAETQATVIQLDKDSSVKVFRDREGNLWQAPVAALRDVTVRGVRVGLGLLLGAVGLLLLIACSNVAHLSVARGLGRIEEMALRRALGANGGSLIRQLFVESLVVAAAGGILGVVLAAVAVKTFIAFTPETLPRGAALTIDIRIVLFAGAISSLTALVFGLLPALQTVGNLRSGFGNRSNTTARSSALLRNGLVIAEVALSLMLLVGAGVLLRSFAAVAQQETGIRTEGVWRVPLSPPEEEDPKAYIAKMSAIRDALENVPGVESATFGLTLPFSFVGGQNCCWRTRVTMVDDPENKTLISVHPVATDYFMTLGIPLALGSAWNDTTSLGSPTPIILPQSTASELFGSPESAIGQSLSTRQGDLEIVAIAADVRHYGLDQAMRPSLYLPIERLPFGMDLAEFAVRTKADAPAGFAKSLREAVWSVAPDLPIPIVHPLEEQVGASTATRRFESVLFGSFGAIALVLAAAGLYGTLLYNVGQRRRELGIRLALGAPRGNVEAHVLRSGAVVAVIGVAIGLAGSWALTRFLESRVWGVEPRDTTSLIGATVLLLTAALLACWLPARKAGRTNPVEALRAD